MSAEEIDQLLAHEQAILSNSSSETTLHHQKYSTLQPLDNQQLNTQNSDWQITSDLINKYHGSYYTTEIAFGSTS